MTVSHGADAERLRDVGRELTTSSQLLGDVATSGRGMAELLVGNWSGPDLDCFVGQDWPMAEKVVLDSSEMLRAVGDAVVGEADEQEGASAADGGATGGGGGSGAPGEQGDRRQGDDGQSRPAEHYGELPPEVREAWEGYTEDERELIVRETIRERAEHYGIDNPAVRIDDSIDGNGVWRERNWFLGPEVVINEDMMDDPMVLHTVFHEMRHGGQHEAIRDADPTFPWEDPEYDHGTTEEEVQEWKENFDDYQSPPTEEEWENDRAAAQEKYDRYFDQPVEVDAREEGSEFVEGMTPEELDRLLEDAEERQDNLDYDGPNPSLPH
ncbi:hypothetical protein [Janibacter anophelis]|uniref:hypothetical protein n=1 Tax=Janibacter anophelis TaxID=319054 RepID=UPI000DEF60FA|nr:hypothetical protein [Janibacter anophelis]